MGKKKGFDKKKFLAMIAQMFDVVIIDTVQGRDDPWGCDEGVNGWGFTREYVGYYPDK